MTSPAVTVDGNPNPHEVNVVGGATVTVQLADLAGVRSWTCRVWSADDLTYPNIATINAGIVIDNATRTATFTAPSSLSGVTLLMESIVNGQVDVNGRFVPEWRVSFGVFVPMPSGRRRLGVGQTTEGDPSFGWVKDVNNLIEYASIAPATAGAGMVFSGGAYNIVATDPSIVVNTDSISVGTLQNATQHGVQVGGTTHALATAGSSGFLSSADKNKLDAATFNTASNTLVQRDASGGTTVGTLTAFTSVGTPSVVGSTALALTSSGGNLSATSTGGPITLASTQVNSNATIYAPNFRQNAPVAQFRNIRLTLQSRNIYWDYTDSGTYGDGIPVNVSASTAARAVFEITEIPQEARIDQITVRIDPPVHGGAWPPAAAPVVSVYKANALTGTPFLLGQVVDSLANQATYESAHNLPISLLANAVGVRTYDKTTDRWWVRVVPESGVNAVSGTLVVTLQVQYVMLEGTSLIGN